MLPNLVNYAEAIDAGEGFIKYKHNDTGLIFANCTEDADRSEENMGTDIVACWTSDEMAVAVRKVMSDEFHAGMKAEFPGSRLVGSSNIEESDVPF